MRIYNYDAFNWLVKVIYIKDHINLQRVFVQLIPHTHTHTHTHTHNVQTPRNLLPARHTFLTLTLISNVRQEHQSHCN